MEKAVLQAAPPSTPRGTKSQTQSSQCAQPRGATHDDPVSPDITDQVHEDSQSLEMEPEAWEGVCHRPWTREKPSAERIYSLQGKERYNPGKLHHSALAVCPDRGGGTV